MAKVNLMSSKLRLTRRRSHRIRSWVTVVMLMSIAAAVPVSISAVQAARAAGIENDIVPVLDHLASAHQNLGSLKHRSAILSTQIDRADALRSKRRWSDLLVLLSRQLPNELWLTKVTSREAKVESKPNTAATKTATGSATGPEVVHIDGPGGLEIRGFATSHEWIYEWIMRLKETSAFTRVELMESASEPVYRGEAVRFVLECEW